MLADLLLTNIGQLVGITQPGTRTKRAFSAQDFQIAQGVSLACERGKIVWIGSSDSLPPLAPHCVTYDARGNVVVPGLIDSHTHMIYAGERVEEFAWRLAGSSYTEIADRGGGINTTVRAVRNASDSELGVQTRHRLQRALSCGITTVEIKSGYGLNTADELRCLEIVGQLHREGPWELVPTFLGAHVVPPEFVNNRADYLQLLIEEMLPAVAKAGAAQFCDVFCDRGAFDVAEARRVLTAARQLGMRLKLHADELSSCGGAELAAELGCISADHLLCISPAGVNSLAASQTVATLLPGTALFLGLPFGRARELIERGIPVALATDSNPGSCPTENLLLMGNLACVQMRMSPLEALIGMTIHGAMALGLEQHLGSLEQAKQADFVICDVERYEQLFYQLGANHVRQVYKRGRLVFDADASRTARFPG